MRSAREAKQFLNGPEPPLGPTGHVPVPLNPVSKFHLATATISDFPREARETSGAVPQVPTLSPECHVRATLCQLHLRNMSFCCDPRKVAGAPGAGVVMGRGWGAHFVRQPESINSKLLLLCLSQQLPRSRHVHILRHRLSGSAPRCRINAFLRRTSMSIALSSLAPLASGLSRARLCRDSVFSGVTRTDEPPIPEST
jgi:hypothetical protein